MIRTLLPLLLAACSIHAAGLNPAQLARIPERMKAFADQGQIAGAVLLVTHQGKPVLFEAVGFQDFEASKPMRKDSIFQVMSMSKPFTGAGIMMLAEEGRLSLNDPVEQHLPEFRGLRVAEKKDGNASLLVRPARPITIRDLMTHTSGMGNRPAEGLKELYTRLDRTLAEAVLFYSQTPLEFQPGTRWLYSNPGIATLGRILEVVSGRPFERFIAERIFEPLGMKDSYFFPPAAVHGRIALVYDLAGGKLKRAGEEILAGDQMRFRAGARYPAPEFGLLSTAADLAAFYNMMLNGGSAGGRRLLSPASVSLMTALHTGELQAGHNPGTGFGLTWEVVKDPAGTATLMSPGTFGHGGAFGTHGWVDRRTGIVGVLLMQRVGPGVTGIKNALIQMVGAAAE